MATAVAAGVLMSAPRASAQEPSAAGGSTGERAVQENIQRLYREAKAAGDRGDMQAAYDLMLQAWELRRAADVAVNLARIEMDLGRWRDAAEHLAFGLDHFPADADPKLAELNRERLATCKQKIVTLELRVEPSTARVSINGRDVGAASGLPRQVFADPGALEIAVSQAGYEPDARIFEARAGETHPVTFALAPSRPDSPIGRELPPPNDGRSAERTLVPAYVGGGLALVAAGIGTAFLIDARSASNRGEELLAEATERFGNQPCAPSRGRSTKLCSDLDETEEQRERSLTISQVSFVTSGVLLAGAVCAYLFWPHPEQETAGRFRLDGYASSTERGLLLRGLF